MLARTRRIVVMALVTVAAPSCDSSRAARPIADLIEQLPVAKKQPADTAFEVAEVTLGGITKRSIVARDQTRLTSHVTVPEHARFRVSVGVDPRAWSDPGHGVLFLVGVSDGQVYQTKRSVAVDPFTRANDRRWHDLDISLEEFAGLTVNIVLNTRRAGEAGAAADRLSAVWGTPVVIVR